MAGFLVGERCARRAERDRTGAGATLLTGGSLLIGRTSIAGDVTWRSLGGKALVQANLVAELLARGATGAAAPARSGAARHGPRVPDPARVAGLRRLDVALRVKRIDGLRLELTDVVFQGRMRGGEITPSPFSLRAEGNALTGALALDTRGDTPAASLWVAGDDVDVGPLLRRLRVARDIESRIGTLRLYADIRERLARLRPGAVVLRRQHRVGDARLSRTPAAGRRCASRSMRARCARMPARR